MGRKTETRGEKIRRLLAKEYAKGTTLPAARKAVAKAIGDPADGRTLLGYDGVYFRLAGLDAPLLDGKGSPLPATPKVGVLRSAVRRRRDSGVRWETLAASIEATLGRTVSVAEARGLYAKAGGDLDASYVGRGTRVGAPATLGAPEVATEAVAT